MTCPLNPKNDCFFCEWNLKRLTQEVVCAILAKFK